MISHRQKLRNKLKRIEGFSLGEAGMDGYPKIELSKVAQASQVDDFLGAITWLVRQLSPNK